MPAQTKTVFRYEVPIDVIPLTSYALHEVAAWIRRWQPDRQIVADLAHHRIVVADESGVLFFEADAVRRLAQTGTGA